MKTIEFIGDYNLNSLVIGNHEPVRLKIIGNSTISGIVYMLAHELELYIVGDVNISLRGVCKQLHLKRVDGNSNLDFVNLKIRDLSCDIIGGQSRLMLDSVRMISNLRGEGDALITLRRQPIIISTCFSDNAKMEGVFPFQSHEVFKN